MAKNELLEQSTIIQKSSFLPFSMSKCQTIHNLESWKEKLVEDTEKTCDENEELSKLLPMIKKQKYIIFENKVSITIKTGKGYLLVRESNSYIK